jgi:hypothetical protein
MMSGSFLSLGRVPAIAVLVLAGGVMLLGQRGARTSVNRSVSSTSVNRSVSSTSVNRSVSSTSVDRSVSSTSVNRNVSSADVNRNVNNVNVNRNVNNVNINRDADVDVDHHYGGWGDGCCYHPAATAAAVTAAAVTTAAVIGSVVHSIPPSCSAVSINGVTFQQCGSTWYQPQFVGTTINYIVVNPPR